MKFVLVVVVLERVVGWLVFGVGWLGTVCFLLLVNSFFFFLGRARVGWSSSSSYHTNY